MKVPPHLIPFAAVALSLGAAWPAAGSQQKVDVQIELYDLGGPQIGAREPAILLPSQLANNWSGPRLRWTGADGPRGMSLGTEGWKNDEVTSADLWWSQGTLPMTQAGTPVAMEGPEVGFYSAASLGNGVLRSSDGAIRGWAPELAIGPNGQRHLVYDRFDGNSYDVIYRDPSGAETVVAGSSAFEAHASIAIDSANRVWIAWDVGSEAWGSLKGLHSKRHIQLVMKDESGWHEIALPEASVLASNHDADRAPFTVDVEIPHLVAEANGPLWLLYRVMQVHPPRKAGAAARRVAWVIRAVVLNANGWTEPVTLPLSDGPNHDTLAAVDLPGSGILAAWTADARLSRFSGKKNWGKSVMEDAHLSVAKLSCATATALGEKIPATAAWETRPATSASAPSTIFAVDPDPEIGPTGYFRLWGDLHRHSDLSRCSMDTDGSVPDQYRYAAGGADLDFIAITDHHQHLTPTAWQFLLDTTDRFLDHSGVIPLFGFERALRDGHRNLITPSRQAAANAPFLERQAIDLDTFSSKSFVAIPHQIAHPGAALSWKKRLADLECQIEVFQRRGSYEEFGGFRVSQVALAQAPYMVDLLQDGHRFGVIASSDHGLNNGAFAVVYAKERTREGIFEALQQRRSYAATAKIALDVRLGSLLMGEEGAVNPSATLAVDVDAGVEIARVEVMRNGEMVHSWDGSDSNVDGAFVGGLLTLRFGALPDLPDLNLSGAGMEFAPGLLFDGEIGVATTMPNGSAWASEMLLHYASRRGLFPSGWSIPVRFKVGGDDPTLSLGTGESAVSWTVTELRAGSEWQKRYSGKKVSIRLNAAPLGSTRLSAQWQPGDWQAGDWVYVRVVRIDGGVAWSSPIWVD